VPSEEKQQPNKQSFGARTKGKEEKMYLIDKFATAQQLLLRLAKRALRIIQRHKERHELVAAFEKTLVPKTEDFNRCYEEKAARESASKKTLKEGYAVSRNLYLANNGWIDLLRRDVAEFDPEPYSSKSLVPDDVMNAASGILEFVRYYQEQSEEPLAYGSELIESLTILLQTTREKWARAQNAMAEQQELKAATRQSAVDLHDELKALRKVLRRVLGTSHRDYQKLRILHGRELAVDEDEVSETTDTAISEMPTQPGVPPFIASS
jgi:hypothetical protein